MMSNLFETAKERWSFWQQRTAAPKNPAAEIAERYQAYLELYGLDRALQEGREWYPRALETCKQIAETDGRGVVPLERVVGLMATYSPRKRWSINVQIARDTVRQWVEQGTYDANGALPLGRERGENILRHPAGEEMIHNPYAGFPYDFDFEQHVLGPKVQSFYQNIMGNPNPVTVDVVMNKASGAASDDVTAGQRRLITHAVNILADRFGMSPRDMQAAIWISYRGTPD